MKVLQLFFVFSLISFVANAGQSFKSNEVSISTHEVRIEACINGADKLYTASPEEYTVVGIPDDIKVVWEYSDDLQSIGGSKNSITLARKYAVGTYVITAHLSNGEILTKTIEAIDAYKP